ncbi:hypothetical protein [Limnoglobus roseus]|uniref:PepSY domain-containing protein n=1 Tax=Limnoglobus roseus TaxID=2598579 RepID=A0A5C1AB11_9BACT|nr:hypothetical protein [Limnoglobus roseus]QEL15407.1 hypothetical protein PX52LOC_02326 [Limnoglobus roseus]
MVKFFAAVAVAALAGSTAFAGGTAISNFQKAFEIAAKDPPPAQLINSRMETKSNGTQVFGFYFYDTKTKKIFEREVSLDTNRVVKDTTKKDDDKEQEKVSKDMLDLLEKKATGKSKLPEGRLMEIAAKLLKDTTIEEMKYEKIGDDLVMTFGDVQINAETGKVIPKK